MSLSSIQLEAFVAVAKSKSFSDAAKRLHLTQSALSQRILNLESDLQISLFVREPSGVRLTDIGDDLLRYCQSKNSLEEEFLSRIKTDDANHLSGLIKIGSFSTLARSRLLPVLGLFGRNHPAVQIELLVREIHELPGLLKSGQADFVFSHREIQKQEVENVAVGVEENVLIESRHRNARRDVYLDHDELDTTTLEFWKLQRSQPKPYRRAYFDEIYTVIDAVEEGFGRAVVPLHLAKDNRRVAIVKNLVSLKVPIYLSYFRQAFYTKLHKGMIQRLSSFLNSPQKVRS